MKIINAFVNVLLAYLTYCYLEKFEKLNCTCAYDMRRDLCKSMILVSYVLVIGSLAYDNIPYSAAFFIILFNIMFEIVFYSYILDLKKKNCACNITQDALTNVYYYYYMLHIFVFLLLLGMTLLFVPLNLYVLKK